MEDKKIIIEKPEDTGQISEKPDVNKTEELEESFIYGVGIGPMDEEDFVRWTDH